MAKAYWAARCLRFSEEVRTTSERPCTQRPRIWRDRPVPVLSDPYLWFSHNLLVSLSRGTSKSASRMIILIAPVIIPREVLGNNPVCAKRCPTNHLVAKFDRLSSGHARVSEELVPTCSDAGQLRKEPVPTGSGAGQLMKEPVPIGSDFGHLVGAVPSLKALWFLYLQMIPKHAPQHHLREQMRATAVTTTFSLKPPKLAINMSDAPQVGCKSCLLRMRWDSVPAAVLQHV